MPQNRQPNSIWLCNPCRINLQGKMRVYPCLSASPSREAQHLPCSLQATASLTLHTVPICILGFGSKGLKMPGKHCNTKPHSQPFLLVFLFCSRVSLSCLAGLELVILLSQSVQHAQPSLKPTPVPIPDILLSLTVSISSHGSESTSHGSAASFLIVLLPPEA